ncbi:MAG TPA: tryptophan 2,3-dioxygenase [Povalibacter sp.]|nr:tryptophan 2,3-dioxygenase [Povalibacter sp.]
MSSTNQGNAAGGTDEVHWNPDLSYGSYLELDRLLSCQRRRSTAHDEMLFIVIHQASELWLKLCVFEVEAAIQRIVADDVAAALKMLARVSRIQAQLTQSWSILATLTPADYSRLRPSLGQSSGFQSWQYRQLEFRLGNKNATLIRAHESNPAAHELLTRVLHEPSLYDVVLQYMHRHGFAIPANVVQRDWSLPYAANETVQASWLEVYQATDRHWALYDLAEKLVDVEHQFQRWRFDHMKTVERIIGYKRGTGGTSGVSYLAQALELRFFPELWNVRTSL